MEPAVVRLLLLLSSFLLFSPFAAAALEPVLDTDGNELKRGAEYYVLPILLETGSGLALASRNRTCPLNVARSSSGSSLGYPVAFLPYDGDGTVRLMTDANFVFSAPAACKQSTVWRLEAAEEATGRAYVATGGVAGTTGPRARSSWFRIEKVQDGGDGGYKIVFCPQPPVCRGCGKPRCGDLGLLAEGGREWLALGGGSRPFAVMFDKAHKCLDACT